MDKRKKVNPSEITEEKLSEDLDYPIWIIQRKWLGFLGI